MRKSDIVQYLTLLPCLLLFTGSVLHI